jgi:hypothetical protein
MKAQAMRSRTNGDELDDRQKDAQPDEQTEDVETRPEADEDDLDESNIGDADDGRWDVFIFDDESDPLPEYGDFWFPD